MSNWVLNDFRQLAEDHCNARSIDFDDPNIKWNPDGTGFGVDGDWYYSSILSAKIPTTDTLLSECIPGTILVYRNGIPFFIFSFSLIQETFHKLLYLYLGHEILEKFVERIMPHSGQLYNRPPSQPLSLTKKEGQENSRRTYAPSI